MLVWVLVCHADLSSPPPSLIPLHTHPRLSPCVRSERPPCVHSKRPVCTGTTPASDTTCGSGVGTHGDVLNVFTGVFSVPHHTARTHAPRPQRHTHKTQKQSPQHYTETGTEKERQRKRDKTRQEKTSRQEKMKEKRQDKTREEKREDERRGRREDERREIQRKSR